MIPTNIRVRLHEDNETIAFAATELQSYLRKMLPSTNIEIRGIDSPDSTDVPEITLCTTPAGQQLSPPKSRFDDEINIRMTGAQGMISGNNPRSVLFAVYRYLKEQGCRWMRPGHEGEYIPEGIQALRSVTVQEQPSYRHRGICIEGSTSYENLRDLIDWMPKVGFNSYFIQFRESYTFFERWYSHINNPTLPPEPFTIEDVRVWVRMAIEEIRRRNLIYHAVGHGWTCEPLGIPGLSWDPVSMDIPSDIQSYFAEVNGKRELWQNIPLNTNLCYSNPEVQNLMINAVVDYALLHPYVDILHFWLADMYNNQCECDRCRHTSPSDFYVVMLNELDRKLTEQGSDVTIVFLLYFELLWAPLKERIANPDRYILMFAPITRTYSKPFSADLADVATPPFVRNKIEFSSSVEESLAFLRGWQQQFPGDSFAFDYHMWLDHYNDPGYYSTAEMIHRDIRNLRSIGLNGLMSCQVQRAFFPTGLNMLVLGQTLWNVDASFEEMVDDYFHHAFGEDGDKCKVYMRELSEAFAPPYLRGELGTVDSALAGQFAQIPAMVESFKEIVDRNMNVGRAEQARSWQLLQYHQQLVIMLSEALTEKARGNTDKLTDKWDALTAYIQKIEPHIQQEFDLFEFIHIMRQRVLGKFKF